jgi:glycosyltransferase involved in cell wall biosynthesis
MSGDQPLITVVIATYNRAKVIPYAIESVLWQTYENFELWIVGDKCTDNTEEVIKPYLKDPRINWYNLPENSGYQSVPNNEGIKRGNGEYIAYLNHDDIWLPNHLESLLETIQKTDADFVFSIIQWIYEFSEEHKHKRTIPDIPILPYMPRPPEATAILHKKSVVDRIGYWKNINETYAYPRVQFFRDAFHAKMKFELAPVLTGLKFLWDEKNYEDSGPQHILMDRIRSDKDYIARELSDMLVRSYIELSQPATRWRLKRQYGDAIRNWMTKNKLDPARLKFWQKKGTQIQIWRKRHQLD